VKNRQLPEKAKNVRYFLSSFPGELLHVHRFGYNLSNIFSEKPGKININSSKRQEKLSFHIKKGFFPVLDSFE